MATTGAPLNARIPVLTDTANVPRDFSNFGTDVNSWAAGVVAAWSSYTPTLTASTTNPTSYATSTTGEAKKIGRDVYWGVRIAQLAGMSWGSGVVWISLPYTAVATASSRVPARGAIQKADGSTIWPITCLLSTGEAKVALAVHTTSGSAWLSAGSPWTLGVGDVIEFSGHYQSAS